MNIKIAITTFFTLLQEISSLTLQIKIWLNIENETGLESSYIELMNDLDDSRFQSYDPSEIIRYGFLYLDGSGSIERENEDGRDEILSIHNYYPFGMEMTGPWQINNGEMEARTNINTIMKERFSLQKK